MLMCFSEKIVVHFRQHAGLIAVDVQQAVLAGIGGQRHFGEVDGSRESIRCCCT